MSMRLIKLTEVEAKVGFRKSSIYQRIAEGTFPRPVKIGPNAVAWPESEIDAWISERIAERDGQS